MTVLEKIYEIYKKFDKEIAVYADHEEITYKDLWEQSDRLASWFADSFDDKKPVIVYGHKNPLMLVCFLACAKSGHAYCPVDTSMPDSRVADIIETIGNPVILAVEEYCGEEGQIYNKNEIQDIIEGQTTVVSRDCWVGEKDTFYIIFTSGSTGKPKGVEISHDNLAKFTDWSEGLFGGRGIMMNQAPFSFDLSVMDTYTALTTGCKLCCMTKEQQKESQKMMQFIGETKVEYIVSTPSFTNLLLADPLFSGETFPHIKRFVFCGEKLTKETTKKLFERFEDATIINSYGPTESTVAVTAVEITREMLDVPEDLPIGVAKPGTTILIQDEEIVIAGDTVGKGYYRSPEKTEEVFFTGEDGQPCYKTGDTGYLEGDMLHYIGRKDFQIKLNGYRIELGDIESNLLDIPGITRAVVLPKKRREQIKSLTAFVVMEHDMDDFQAARQIKAKLGKSLPSYMIPKKIKFIESVPLNTNGKIDRKSMEEWL